MSDRYRFYDTWIVDGDLGGNITSPSVKLDRYKRFCITIQWEGAAAPNGSFTVQASNNNTSWSTITGSTVSTGGIAGNQTWNSNGASYKYFRLVYKRVGGGAADKLQAQAAVKD